MALRAGVDVAPAFADELGGFGRGAVALQSARGKGGDLCSLLAESGNPEVEQVVDQRRRWDLGAHGLVMSGKVHLMGRVGG